MNGFNKKTKKLVLALTLGTLLISSTAAAVEIEYKSGSSYNDSDFEAYDIDKFNATVYEFDSNFDEPKSAVYSDVSTDDGSLNLSFNTPSDKKYYGVYLYDPKKDYLVWE